jgi:hypothetical protein
MPSPPSLEFDLADGTNVTLEGDDLLRLYQELWVLSEFIGATSAAALLIEEAGRHAPYRRPVSLNGPQTVAFRRALEHSASPAAGRRR